MAFLPGSYHSPDEYTDRLLSFLDKPLIRQITGGIHVNDALIYGAWEALPVEWTAWWDSLPDHRIAQQDLIDSIDENKGDTSSSLLEKNAGKADGRPESLGDWLHTLKTLGVPRAQRQGLVVDLPDALKARMNTKKTAEVAAAAAHIEQACRANGITNVIDMGSGQGYLSVSLAFLFPHLRVLAIDGSESQIAGSKAFAASVGIIDAETHGDSGRLCHLHRWIDGKAPLAAEMEAWAGGQRCMLVGLHACGQLSEHMIRYFSKLPWITALGAVGCCYNHIVPYSAACPDGFPISTRLRRTGVALSPTAMMTGCQAPNNWPRTDLTRGEESIYTKRRFYRTLLEKILCDKGIKWGQEDRPTWVSGKGDHASFEIFAIRAMRSLKIPPEKITADEMRAYQERYTGHESKVAILWTLSVLCCKIVESAIVMDRYWFLVEQGINHVDVLPIFDYRTSPRNLMIVSNK
jgi:hypothetical protein